MHRILKNKKLLIVLLFIVLLGLFLVMVRNYSYNDVLQTIQKDDIAIIYTNDTHGVSKKNLGFDSLAHFKSRVESKTNNVITVDSGDDVEGSYMVKSSDGKFAAKMMNEIGYDYATLGNHDFNLDDNKLQEFIDMSNVQFLACNYNAKKIKPYHIKEINGKKIAFIGVAHPMNTTPEILYKQVQSTINEVKNNDANFVILLTHLGEEPKQTEDFTVNKLANNISGADIILDGHTHSTIKDIIVNNIHICQAGSSLRNFGLITISHDNAINFNMIDEYNDKNEQFTKFIEQSKKEVDPNYDEVMCKTEAEIPYNGEGNMMSSSREDPLGNLLCDSYLEAINADCAITNATGYRSNIPKGNVTKEDMKDLFAFGDDIEKIEVTGADLQDIFEHACRKTQREYQDENGYPVGSCAEFMQVANINFRIDTSVSSSVKTDGRNSFVAVIGERRVKDIKVKGEPLNINKIYTLVTSKYLAGGGCGLTMLKDKQVLETKSDIDNILCDFINNKLNGKTSEYIDTKDRIVVN